MWFLGLSSCTHLCNSTGVQWDLLALASLASQDSPGSSGLFQLSFLTPGSLVLVLLCAPFWYTLSSSWASTLALPREHCLCPGVLEGYLKGKAGSTGCACGCLGSGGQLCLCCAGSIATRPGCGFRGPAQASSCGLSPVALWGSRLLSQSWGPRLVFEVLVRAAGSLVVLFSYLRHEWLGALWSLPGIPTPQDHQGPLWQP